MTDSAWEKIHTTYTVKRYPSGWHGLWLHFTDVIHGRLCRTSEDVTVSVYVKPGGQARLMTFIGEKKPAAPRHDEQTVDKP